MNLNNNSKNLMDLSFNFFGDTNPIEDTKCFYYDLTQYDPPLIQQNMFSPHYNQMPNESINLELLINSYEWLRLVQNHSNDYTLICAYCEKNLFDSCQKNSLTDCLYSHEDCYEHKQALQRYQLIQQSYPSPSTKSNSNSNIQFKHEEFDTCMSSYEATEVANSAKSPVKSSNTQQSILKAINNRKIHIPCPICNSKVVNMSDHLVKKHNIKDRNQRKSLLDSVRRNYLSYIESSKVNSTSQQLQVIQNSSIFDREPLRKSKKQVKCPLCPDENKSFVNISDHLIKIHHLSTSEERKPVLKSIKLNDKRQEINVNSSGFDSSLSTTDFDVELTNETQNGTQKLKKVDSLENKKDTQKLKLIRKNILKRYSLQQKIKLKNKLNKVSQASSKSKDDDETLKKFIEIEAKIHSTFDVLNDLRGQVDSTTQQLKYLTRELNLLKENFTQSSQFELLMKQYNTQSLNLESQPTTTTTAENINETTNICLDQNIIFDYYENQNTDVSVVYCLGYIICLL